jgi:hypothetical protein
VSAPCQAHQKKAEPRKALPISSLYQDVYCVLAHLSTGRCFIFDIKTTL